MNSAGTATDLQWATRDPVGFSRAVLRHDPWPLQEEVLRAVATDRRVAVKACHASGKTFLAADAVLWWITTFPDGVAVTTAPTWTQVERVLWGAIHRAAQGAVIRYPPLNQTDLRLGPDNYAIGLSTNEGVRFQGFHGRVLVVLDEAPGVMPEIWEAVEGIRAGGDVCVLALGNPTVTSGPFYDAFTSNREGWRTFTISAFDSPNLAGLTVEDLSSLDEGGLDEAARPYLVTRRWVREKQREWGEGHPLWASRVLGQFPAQSEDSLLSLAWLEATRTRELEVADSEKWVAGLDVAGPGEDETVLVVRHGGQIVLMKAWSGSDPRGAVVAALQPFKEKGVRVNVDSVGIGYYLARHLRDAGFRVSQVNVGRASRDKERFANRKAELYWGLRQRIEDGHLAGLTDDRAISQLASIRYRHNARGQIVIESKDDMRRRGVKSPDRAEAIMLAYKKPVDPLAQIHVF